uniref:Uncharacterized protein n=1 Tax=Parascaris equorum TaxID=6256 RepID=A0A914RHH9_PAREQ
MIDMAVQVRKFGNVTFARHDICRSIIVAFRLISQKTVFHVYLLQVEAAFQAISAKEFDLDRNTETHFGNMHCIHHLIQEDEKAYVKHESKRVHVSCSGMVVSDGIYITSMDHLGRIVSCS